MRFAIPPNTYTMEESKLEDMLNTLSKLSSTVNQQELRLWSNKVIVSTLQSENKKLWHENDKKKNEISKLKQDNERLNSEIQQEDKSVELLRNSIQLIRKTSCDLETLNKKIEEKVAYWNEKYETAYKEYSEECSRIRQAKIDGNSPYKHLQQLKAEKKLLYVNLMVIQQETKMTHAIRKKQTELQERMFNARIVAFAKTVLDYNNNKKYNLKIMQSEKQERILLGQYRDLQMDKTKREVERANTHDSRAKIPVLQLDNFPFGNVAYETPQIRTNFLLNLPDQRRKAMAEMSYFNNGNVQKTNPNINIISMQKIKTSAKNLNQQANEIIAKPLKMPQIIRRNTVTKDITIEQLKAYNGNIDSIRAARLSQGHKQINTTKDVDHSTLTKARSDVIRFSQQNKTAEVKKNALPTRNNDFKHVVRPSQGNQQLNETGDVDHSTLNKVRGDLAKFSTQNTTKAAEVEKLIAPTSNIGGYANYYEESKNDIIHKRQIARNIFNMGDLEENVVSTDNLLVLDNKPQASQGTISQRSESNSQQSMMITKQFVENDKKVRILELDPNQVVESSVSATNPVEQLHDNNLEGITSTQMMYEQISQFEPTGQMEFNYSNVGSPAFSIAGTSPMGEMYTFDGNEKSNEAVSHNFEKDTMFSFKSPFETNKNANVNYKFTSFSNNLGNSVNEFESLFS